MSVINLQRNHSGIQAVSTELANYKAAGQGAMLTHTDGYVYCIYAANYMNTVVERRLYMSRSTDKGYSWSDAIELTTGYVDDKPAIMQFDPTDPDSDIAVVFTRGDSMVRVLINKETGAANTPFDDVTNASTMKAGWIGVAKTSTGYLIAAIKTDSIGTPAVQIATNVSFTTNNWAWTTAAIFPTNQQPMSLSLKKLSNGDLALIGVYRTSLNGAAATSQVQNLPQAMIRCDVGVSFSDDDGNTWTTLQQLTNYTGTLTLDLIGIDHAASVDLDQLSDGTVVVAYQEQTAPQFIATSTSSPFVFPVSSGQTRHVTYHSGHNLLIACADDTTNGGVWVFDLTNQTSTRIYTSSTPAIWTNDVRQIRLSPDETKLAIGMATGGICILDVTDADPANWTIIKELRTTSVPDISSDSIHQLEWADDDKIVWSFTAVAGGQYYILSTDSVITWTIAGTNNNMKFAVHDDNLYIATQTFTPAQSYLKKVSLTTGVTLGSATLTTNHAVVNAQVVYDTLSSEIIISDNLGLTRVTDGVGSLTEVAYYTPTSDPAVAPGVAGSANVSIIEVSGVGLFYDDQNWNQLAWYSFHSHQPAGPRVNTFYTSLGENTPGSTITKLLWGSVITGPTGVRWLALPGNSSGISAQVVFQPLDKVGRIRYAYFDYDTLNKQLVTTGVDFYDLANPVKLADLTHLQFPRFCCDADDRLYFYFNRWNIDQTSNELSPVIGVVEPDAQKITVLARILRHQLATIDGKSRIRNTVTRTLAIKTRLAIIKCLGAKSYIVARNTKTITARATIRSSKSTIVPMTFSVRNTMSQRLRSTFYVNGGGMYAGTCTMQSHIVKIKRARVTGHFFVPASSVGGLVTFATVNRTLKQLSMRTKIAAP